MHFNCFSDNVHFLARKVHISENCEPRTETPHSRNIYNSIVFYDSRELHPNSILEHFQKLLYFQLKTHDSATSLPSLQEKLSLFYLENNMFLKSSKHALQDRLSGIFKHPREFKCFSELPHLYP